MNEFNSTRFSSFIKLFSLVLGLSLASMSSALAQVPSCACHGAIQLSVDDNCQAIVSASSILADGSTCGGVAGAIVTLMKTPTSGIIATGVEEAVFNDAYLYIGKTIYGKVTDANGVNSCWTTINVEDKMKPRWVRTTPDTIVTICPAIGSFLPEATDNCHPPKIFQVSEEIIVNKCDRPDLFAGPDTLKLIKKSYRAIDESGNISETDCVVWIYVVTLSVENLIGVKNVQLECDAPYAKIPSGPFAGHPSPTDIGTLIGSGVPSLHAWYPTTRGAGKVDVNPINGNLRLTGGTDAGTSPGMGAQLCFTANADGTVSFDWSAIMQGSIPPPGNFNGDHARYRIGSGAWVNITSAGPGTVGQNGTITGLSILKGEEFCFRVRTDNNARWTELMVSNFQGPIDAAIPLNPDVTDLCDIYVTYEDVEFPEVKCVKKIMRTWKILEWQNCTSRYVEFVQIIEIVDSKAPVISKLDRYYESSTNGHSCEGLFRLPKPALTDNCSSNLKYDVTYPGGFIKGAKVTDTDRFIALPVGCNEVTITAFDGCLNQSTFNFVVEVTDNTPPVAVCDQNTVIGLTTNGQAWVHASSFDDGSYDDCALSMMLVRRMVPGCEPCAVPIFPDYTYLGEFVNAGSTKPHYYYMSKTKTSPNVAFKTAAAMGGYVVAINNATEDAWVYSKVQEWKLKSDYLIGLRDIKKYGQHTWVSGESSTYRNWTTGSPTNTTEYAAVKDAFGTWYDFSTVSCDANEYYYVVEIADPCGFNSGALFCCSDVALGAQMVQLRVIDKSGNWNDCMVNALVQDKLPPSIVCPADQTVHCDDYFDVAKLRETFGWPVTFDNCDPIKVVTDSIVDLNSCRIGTITRTFTATDPGGRTATCTQKITVLPSRLFAMTEDRWPVDHLSVEGCENPNDPKFGPDFMGRPDLTTDNICSLVGAQYEDQVFYFNNGAGEACFKILRHWTVLDWCNYQVSTGGGHIYQEWKHTQIIMVSDRNKPIILSGCDYQSVCTYDPKCQEGYIEMTATATDVCTEQLTYNYKVYLNGSSSFDPRFSKSGLATVTQNRINVANASGTYPIGKHKIVWSFEDRCGNVTSCTKDFTISNCKAPTPYCINGLATSLMPMNGGGMVEIWASDFDKGSSHPCGYTIYHSFEPMSLDKDGNLVQKKNRIFTCDSLGKRDVRVYVGVLTPSGELIQDYCTTFITVQDNQKICPKKDSLVVSGSITNAANKPVKDVLVSLEGSELNMLTSDNGTFNFAKVTKGGSYILRPQKKDDYMNGVSTLDIVHIQRHILGIEKMNTGYKMIAADVNNDQKVTASDLTELRKLILGVTDSFVSNDSWKFYDKSYNFKDESTAESEILPLAYSLDNIQDNQIVDFRAVKIGDVDNSAVANANDVATVNRSSDRLHLAIENQKFVKGQSIEVPVYLTNNADVTGFQFTLNFDNEMFNLEAINSPLAGVTDNNFGFTRLSEGRIAVSYNKEKAMNLEQGAKVLVVTLKAKADGNLNNALNVGSEITKAEAYDADLNVMHVDLQLEERNTDNIVLYQNTPNPFKSTTSIGFELPQTSDVTITIYDMTGKTLKVVSQNFGKGFNTVEINKQELGAAGVLYYTMESGDFKATRKMVVIE